MFGYEVYRATFYPCPVILASVWLRNLNLELLEDSYTFLLLECDFLTVSDCLKLCVVFV